MDNIERSDISIPATAFRLSWVAYVRPVLVFIIILGAAAPCPTRYRIILGVLDVAWLVYQVLDVREVRLFVNDDGVWVRRGRRA